MAKKFIPIPSSDLEKIVEFIFEEELIGSVIKCENDKYKFEIEAIIKYVYGYSTTENLLKGETESCIESVFCINIKKFERKSPIIIQSEFDVKGVMDSCKRNNLTHYEVNSVVMESFEMMKFKPSKEEEL